MTIEEWLRPSEMIPMDYRESGPNDIFSKYDPITKAALQRLYQNAEFRELWNKVNTRWGHCLTIEPVTGAAASKVNYKASTQYNHVGTSMPTRVQIKYNASRIESVRAYYILLELCNVERLDDYTALDREIPKLSLNEFATKRERIEWDVLRKTARISESFSPSLFVTSKKVVASFDEYLRQNKISGHFDNYWKLGLITKVKLHLKINFIYYFSAGLAALAYNQYPKIKKYI